MPAPDPVTDLEIESPPGSPLATLSWDHNGADLDRFQVLSRPDDVSPWSSLLIAPKVDFGAGPYSLEVVSTSSTRWAVRALSVDGEVST